MATGADFVWLRCRRIAGIDVGRAAVKLVVLQRTLWRWRLESYRVVTVKPSGPDAVQEAVAGALAETVRPCRVVASLPATQALIHSLALPGPVPDRDIESWVLQAASKHLPCASDDVLMDYCRVGDGNTIMLAAIKKDLATRRTEQLRHCGLEPDVLDLDALALRRSIVVDPAFGDQADHGRVLLVDAGAASVRLHALQGSQILYSREQLSSGLQDLSPEDMRWRLVQEVRRALQLFQASSASGAWTRVILAGGYAAVADLDVQLSELAGVNVVLADPFVNLQIHPGLDPGELAKLKTTLAQACGLAISQVARCRG